MTRSVALVLTTIVAAFIVAACPEPSGAGKPIIERNGWSLRALESVPVADVYEIVAIQESQLPSYETCRDRNGEAQQPEKCAMSLLILPSPDYDQETAGDFTMHAQTILQQVFDSENSFNRREGLRDRLEPFKFYITDYRYPTNTPDGKGKCSPGLPLEWAPQTPNLGDIDLPAFNCNIALSTAGVEINVGFVMHQQPENDRSRSNLFSSEYNSYAAILHELSHAAFVISDEAPNADNSGRFLPIPHSNIFADSQQAECQAICRDTYQSQCVPIDSLDAQGMPLTIPSGYYRCAPDDDQKNLMYFSPQPAPGDNENWNSYIHHFAAVERLHYVYEKCSTAQC